MSNQRNDISIVVSQQLCHSCGACFACCDNGSIDYAESIGGYVFPRINARTCIHCGLCYEVCPGWHFGKTLTAQMPEDPFVGYIDFCEIGRAKDEGVFLNGQSGGVATAFLTHLFETGQIEVAIVAVMKESIPPKGDVLVVTNPSDLIKAQKSKYSPIPILKAIRDIASVKGGVALTGLPCHMHGLYNLSDTLPILRQHNIFKIGLVCDRVMTSSAIDFLGEKAFPSVPIKNLVWRDKLRPSYPGNPVVTTVTGEDFLLTHRLRMAIKDFFTPLRCRLCFDKLNIFSDLVLGDPHGIKEADRLNGETLVFVRTEKGMKLVESAKTSGAVILRNTSNEAALQGQKIETKRKEWAGYMQAWEEMGNASPVYPFSVSPPNKTNVYRLQLLHGIRLNEFQSRAKIRIAANIWLFKQKVLSLVKIPFSKTKRVLSVLRKGRNSNGC